MEDAKRLHDQSVKLLAGVLSGKVVPKPGLTKEDLIEVLKQNIDGTRKMLDRYGWRDDA